MKRKEAPHSEDPLYGASSSWTSLQVHEVFLSFRRRDTRRGFTDYLYTSLVDVGIRVFRDDNELKVGEEFGPELVCIITQSKISIRIISKNYASSKWCLHELAQMLKCKRSIGQLVLPIFFKVEPPQLRHLTGRFRDAINAHKGHLDEMVVKEWEEALKEVSTLEGWESEKIDFGHEGTLIKLFVKKVMSELKELFQLFVPEQLVGIDDHVEQIMSMIDDKSDGTSIVGIYGMSGVDETTIAKRRGIEGLILMFVIKEDKDGKLMMHDQMRDLGRQIVRLENPRKPKKHNRLWIHEEAVDVLDNNKSIEKMEDEAIQRAADMETSDRNYAIAAVQNIVGIDDRVKQITDLLEMEVSDEVRIIGIYGTDGMGKTTLAKAVYKCISSYFDSCSFLTEVEETTQNSHGIQFLQKKLILDLLERDCDETIEDFLDIFREMRVLIVVDDVERPSDLIAIVGDQLHWFGPGSRIIVTSKNSGILKEYDPEKACNYMVSELDDGRAFELFCKHAFRMQSSMPDYDGFSNRIVNATEKLPLAVEVIGSFLRGKSIQEWKKMEKSMKKRIMSSQKTTVGLEEILDICYKEIDQQQKDIFLDIACFISGVDARIASYMWPNCYPSSGCILMPLAKIGENNELQVHRLLRRLGKRIFEQEGSGDPIGRKFYVQEKGKENVEALPIDFTAEYFEMMPELRFLKLDNAKVSGNFEGAFASLRWLRWQGCHLDFSAENLLLTELVILDLSWSKFTEDWGGWAEIKMEKLKVLNLTGCSDLLITPDFSDYKDLEILILQRCSRLVKLHPSIGHLKRLVSLNLKFCSRLHRLPEELGCATALKELFIDGTSVRQIPISIGNLKQLEILSGSKCFPLTHLPSSICYLTALSEFLLEGANISELPSSLGKLLKLRRLSLRDCRYLEELPYSIGEIRSLEELDISASIISELPDSVRNLKSLRVLRMDFTFIREFPGEIGNLTNLEELHASRCQNLRGAIPSDIEGLCHLRSLTLGHSSVSGLPPNISTISGLHTLDLIQCDEIEELPKLPPSLICLRVSSKRMKAIPLLENLKELEELYLSDGHPKARRPPSKQLKPESSSKQVIDKPSFSISFPKLRKLELSLSQIIKLKFDPTDIPQQPTLPGLNHKEVSELPKTLLVFKLYHSAIEEIEGLERLKTLKRLDISNCKIQNLDGIGQITSLRSLILSDCDDLSLPDLSNLESLKVLEITRCKMIHQIEGLEKLTSLEKLIISECPPENSVLVQNALEDVMARSPLT